MEMKDILQNIEKLAIVQRMGETIVNAQKEQYSAFNWGQVDKQLLPKEIMIATIPLRDAKECMTWGKKRESNQGIQINSRNIDLIEQLARAIAQIWQWEVYGDAMQDTSEYDAPESTGVGNKIISGTVLRHKITGQYIAAVMAVKDRKERGEQSNRGEYIAEVYEFNHVKKSWRFHAITKTVRDGDDNGRQGVFAVNRLIGDFCPAWTKYHMIAEILCGDKVYVIENDPTVTLNTAKWWEIMQKTYRHEMWSKVQCYDWRTLTPYERAWREAQEQVEKLRKAGWLNSEIWEQL